MNGIVPRDLAQINAFKNAIRYSTGLLLTKGRKVCTELAAVLKLTHDLIQRDLCAIARHPSSIESHLVFRVIEKNREKRGFLIVDNTALVKEYAKNIEGVSRQHIGSENKNGIGR